jgi:hypothetical protein
MWAGKSILIDATATNKGRVNTDTPLGAGTGIGRIALQRGERRRGEWQAHRLQNNASGGSGNEVNLACQYDVLAGNFNATGNTRNGVAIGGADGSPFPSGCQ